MKNYELLARAFSSRVMSNQLFRIMRVTTFFLLIGCMHLSAASWSQTVTLRAKNQSLQQVFELIEKQTGYWVVYSDNLISTAKPITIDARDMALPQFLDKILKPQSLAYTMDAENILIMSSIDRVTRLTVASNVISSLPQQRMIRGKVIDEDGNPLQSVTVAVKNTRNSALTDANGNYEIEAQGEDVVLVFTIVGYANNEEAIGSSEAVDVVMIESVSDLDEVVVVGMNIRQTKRSITGAMATIQTKELKQSPVANLNNALAGRLPGLVTVQSSGQPGDDAAAMYIRGIATYGSNTAPLVVIDGLPRGQGSFSQIDPNEVESVSILKDASSSALYGIQGANGVIVVTTKRGRDGQKPSIDFTAQTAVQQVVRLPEPISTYESALYFNEYDINNNSGARFSEEALEIVKAGSDLYLYPEVNWFDEILKKDAQQSQYNLNISGSSNRVRYFVSGSHINQGALLKHEDTFYQNYGKKNSFKRYNFRSNIDIQATKDLQVQVDLAGRLEQRVGPMPSFGEVFNQINNMPPFAMPILNPDGSLGAASNVEIPFWRNPYGLVTQSGYYENSTNVMYGTISAKHNLDFITSGLSIQGFFSFENNNFNRTSREQEFDSYWYRGLDIDGLPRYQQTRIATTLATGGYNNIERSNYLDARLIYNRTWNEHEVSGQVLANRTFRIYNYDLPYAYQGVSGRFTYGYRSKYFLEANLGYNGSENFPLGERYGFFPSASFAWIISEESFLQPVEWLNSLKIRGSYGLVGNDKIGGQRWLYLSDFSAGGGYSFGTNMTWQPGYNESRVGNPFVTWEHSDKANLGFDLSVTRNDMFQLTFDVFYEKRTDILTEPGTVNDYLGIGSLAPLNTGIVENKGLDAELRFNKRWNDFSVFSNFQITYARNKVIQNDQPTPAFAYQDLRGYEVGYQLGYRAIGFFSNQEEIDNSARQSFDNNIIPGSIRYMDANGDGVIDAFDRVPIQIQNVPRYMSGLSVGVSYKEFDISFLLNGAIGGTARYIPKPLDPIIKQRWTPENQDEARVPVAKNSSNNTLVSDFYNFKTDYLKLRNAEVGYVLPYNLVNRIGVQYARLFINGQNLAIWDKLWIKDRDPEVSGTSNLPYPIQRIFNLGVNIKL